jgi:DNA modification methylase
MNRIEFGDCRETMRRWASEGIKAQTCVTSPPYYGLRDYGTGKWVGGDESCSHKRDSKYSEKTITGHANKALTVGDAIYKSVCPKCGAVREDKQLGLEETPEEYIAAMVEVFRCVWDVLADDGTLWLNIGDSYARQGGRESNQPRHWDGRDKTSGSMHNTRMAQDIGLKPKDLIGIPWMLAFALRADGWYLRQDIIWHKPNPMPESVADRCTKAHEYIFLLSKSPKYYYDHEAIKEEASSKSEGIRFGGNKYGDNDDPKYATKSGNVSKEYDKANKRSVWTVPVKPYAGAHFAVFPSELIEPCILAGAPAGGIVLDPFMGSGTTAQVSENLGRKYLGCELNPYYKKLQDKRLRQIPLEFA